MASPETIDKRRAVLKARGVPDRFVDPIATRKGSGTLWGVTVLTVFMTAVAAITLTLTAFPLAAPLVPVLYSGAPPSLLFYTPHSVPLLVTFGLMTVIFIAFAVYAGTMQPKSARPHPAYDTQGETLRILPPGESLPMIMPDERFAGLADLPDDAAFLDAVRRLKRAEEQPWRARLIILAWVAIVMVFSFASPVLEALRYQTVTLDAVERHRLGRTHAYPLADAQYAEVRCHGGTKYGFSYRLVYGRDTFDIWEERDDLHRLGAGGVLQRLAQVDRRLAGLGIPIHRMGRTGSPGDDASDCIRDMARAWKLDNGHALTQLVFGAEGGQR